MGRTPETKERDHCLDSNEDDDNKKITNKSDMVSIPDQEDIDPRIKQLTGRDREESSNESGDENQPDAEFLRQIG